MGRASLLVLLLSTLLSLIPQSARAKEEVPPMNLLANPNFDFHAFENHRAGKEASYTSNNVAFWNTDAWGDITVLRESHVEPQIRPSFSTHNLVRIAPGKKLWQFIPLPEVGLAHGDHVSLCVYGYQSEANALAARIELLKLDSEDGTWVPADLGMLKGWGSSDKQRYPRHSRGELVVAKSYRASSDRPGTVELRVENAEILGRFHTDKESHSDDINTIAVQVVFENTGREDVWAYSPCLTVGATAAPRLPSGREMTPYYRFLPRTIQKLWKGEPIHIIIMGSSIDTGDANPEMYLYDEDPASPTFKQPLADGTFDPERIGRPDLAGYIGLWKTYFAFGTRLRLELMRKFDLPANKILLNVMARGGSSIGESHSGLAEYCSLSIPPGPGENGHPEGKTWKELYPDLFARPEGPRPDLVVFGSGANERTDTPDEVAVFEGAIRWIQSHYPETEFLFCQFQKRGGYTPNPGDLMALSLRYQIPFIDFGKTSDDVTRWCSAYALVPQDGHPQAAAHYLWFKQLEKAFECWDPILPGQVQLQLPERVHPATYGWEGDMVTYGHGDARIKGGSKFILDDTAFNCWGDAKEEDAVPYVDGEKKESRGNFASRDIRNSFFRHGRLRLGDRHVLELGGTGPRLTAVDAKVCPERRYVGVDSALWRLGKLEVTPFTSAWGAPYGNRQVVMLSGGQIEVDVVGTDISVAYVDAPGGGTMRVLADGVERLVQPTNVPLTTVEGGAEFIENRKGVLGLGYGMHTVRIKADGGPVAVLGVFVYDSRSNRHSERRLAGLAAAGDSITFSPAFKARPAVITSDGLAAKSEDITPTAVTFSGKGIGSYEIIGE